MKDWPNKDNSDLTNRQQNFIDKVDVKRGPNGELDYEACWEWTGYIAPDGYGRFRLDDRVAPAHRAAIELFDEDRELPDGRLRIVQHECHNTPCVNLEHLTIGSQSSNVQASYDEGDKVANTRGVERSDGFNESDIRRMHQLYVNGWLQREIADEYNITQSDVSMVLSGEIYGYVDVEDIYDEGDE